MSCNPFMKTGRTYLVYARDIGGKLVTGLCTRTAEISDRQHELAVLRALRDGEVSMPRVVGHVSERRLQLNGSGGADRIPLERVRVSIEGGPNRAEAITENNGSFLITGLPAGNYSLKASLPRPYEYGRDAIEFRLRCLSEVSIVVARVPLFGTLSLADGSLPGWWPHTITAVAVDGNNRVPIKSRSVSTITQSDLRWSFVGLPPGRYLIGVDVFVNRGR